MTEYEIVSSKEKEKQDSKKISLLSIFEKSLKDYQGPSITIHSKEGDHQSLTGKELWQKSIEYAQGLKTIGIHSGDRVACVLESGIDFAALFLACLHVKATFCPLLIYDDTKDEANTLRRSRTTDPRIILCSKSSKFTSPYRLEISYLNEVEYALLRETKRLSSENLVAIIWSSTSQTARAIGISENNLLHQVHVLKDIMGIQEGEKVCAHLNWRNSFGFVVEMLLGLISRANLIVYYPERLEDEIFIQFVSQYPESYLFTWAGNLDILLSDTRGQEWLKSSKGGIIVAKTLSAYACESLKKLNLNYRQGYYITEATSLVCTGEKGIYSPNLIGKPIGCEMKISPAETLMVKGPSVAEMVWYGYSPDLEDGWFDTKDLVEQYSDGNYIFQGRANRTWKWSNGETYNPYPFETDLRERSQSEVIVFKGDKDTLCIVVISPKQSILEIFTESERKEMIWVHPDEVKEYRTGTRWFYHKLAQHVMKHYLADTIEEELILERSPKIHIGHKLKLTLDQLFHYLEDTQSHLVFSVDTDWAVSRAYNFANKRDLNDGKIEGWNFSPHSLLKQVALQLLEKETPFLPHNIVLSTMIGRLQALSQGKSAISKGCFDWFSEACKMRLTPYIPLHNQKGFAPIIYALSAWNGQGHFITEKGEIVKAKEYLKKNHVQSIPLKGRDSIAIIYGSNIELGITSVAFGEYTKIFATIISISGLLYDCFEADLQSVDYYYHRVSGHAGNTKIAELLRRTIINKDRPFDKPRIKKETEFIHALPQILGAIFTHLTPQRKIVEEALNGAGDSILFDIGRPDQIGTEKDASVSKKNISDNHLYLAAHQLNNLCAQTKNIIVQLIHYFDPSLSNSIVQLLDSKKIQPFLELGTDSVLASWETYESCQTLSAWVAALLISLKRYMLQQNHPLILNSDHECFVFLKHIKDDQLKDLTVEDLKKIFLSFLDLKSIFVLNKELLIPLK